MKTAEAYPRSPPYRPSSGNAGSGGLRCPFEFPGQLDDPRPDNTQTKRTKNARRKSNDLRYHPARRRTVRGHRPDHPRRRWRYPASWTGSAWTSSRPASPPAPPAISRPSRPSPARVRRPIIASLARCVLPDVDAAWEAIKDAERPRIHVFISSSDVQIMHQLRSDPERVLDAAVASVERAKEYCDDVEFSPMDATPAPTSSISTGCWKPSSTRARPP